jgi:SH3-like domain-containing protein
MLPIYSGTYFRSTITAVVILAAAALIMPSLAHADYIVVKSSYLNVRSGPGTSFEVIRTITEGESFQLAETKGLWCRIKLENGSEAWIYRSYVEIRKGDMPGLVKDTPAEEEEKAAEKGGSAWAQLVFIALLLIGASLAVWKRHELMDWFGRSMQSASGYRREDPFRYDNGNPDRDDWKM